MRRDPGLVERLRARLPADHLRVAGSLDEVGDALAALHAAGADALFTVGGDGTVTGTLSELMRVWPHDALPRVAFAPGGTINTIAKSLGARGEPDQILTRFLDAPDAVVASPRPTLRVCAPGEPERHGMIFALGAASRWLESYYAGNPGPAGAASLVARILASAAVGGSLARRIFQQVAARVDVDGQVLESGFTVMGAGSVRHVGLVFAPFRSAGSRPDRFHWLDSRSAGWRLAAEVPAFAVGVYRDDSCLRHASARRSHVTLASPEVFTIDAELFGPVTELTVEAGPTLQFLSIPSGGEG